DALPHPVEGGHAQGSHALPYRDLAQLPGVGARDDELADFIRDRHRFNNSHAPGVAGVLAAVATATAKESNAVEEARVNVQVLKHLSRIGDGFLAMGTDPADQPLRA